MVSDVTAGLGLPDSGPVAKIGADITIKCTQKIFWAHCFRFFSFKTLMACCGGVFTPPVFVNKPNNNFYTTDQLNAKVLKNNENAIKLDNAHSIKLSLKSDEETLNFNRDASGLSMNVALPKLTIVTGKNPKSNLSLSVNDVETKYTSSNAKQTFATNNNNSFLEVILKDHYSKLKTVARSTTRLKANSKAYASEKELNIDADRLTLTAPKGVEIKGKDSLDDRIAFIHEDDTLKINPYKHYKHGVEVSPLKVDADGNVRIGETQFFYNNCTGLVGINNEDPRHHLDVVGTIRASTGVITSKIGSDRDNLILHAPNEIVLDSKQVRMNGDLSVDLIDHAVFNDKVLVLNRTAPDTDRTNVFPSQTSDGAGIFVNNNFRNLPTGMRPEEWQQAFKWYYRGGLFQDYEDDFGRQYTDMVPAHNRSSWVLSGGNFTIQGGANQASFMFAIENDTLNMYKLKTTRDGSQTLIELCGVFG